MKVLAYRPLTRVKLEPIRLRSRCAPPLLPDAGFRGAGDWRFHPAQSLNGARLRLAKAGIYVQRAIFLSGYSGKRGCTSPEYSVWKVKSKGCLITSGSNGECPRSEDARAWHLAYPLKPTSAFLRPSNVLERRASRIAQGSEGLSSHMRRHRRPTRLGHFHMRERNPSMAKGDGDVPNSEKRAPPWHI